MKAARSDKPFSSPDWVFERKLDGERCGALRRDGKLTLLSRTGSVMDAALLGAVDVLPVKGPELLRPRRRTDYQRETRVLEVGAK
jgi:hypothetical protein